MAIRCGSTTPVGLVGAYVGTSYDEMRILSTNIEALLRLEPNAQVLADNVADLVQAATLTNLYLGPKATDPIVDNIGNPLDAGDFYFNTVTLDLRYYDGTTWDRPIFDAINSAAAALASENTVTTQADISTTQAGISTTQASISTTQAGISTTQAGIATTQAGIATTAAGTATTQADIATTGANTATTQAGIASTGANTATTQAGIASTGANTATTQAGIATTQANRAETEADRAEANAASVDPSLLVNKDSQTGAALLPTGTTAQRPVAPAEGMFRRNSETSAFEGYDGTAWTGVGGASGGAGNPFTYQHDNIVSASHTIPASQNAISAGPLTINDGVTITVDNGANWVVV